MQQLLNVKSAILGSHSGDVSHLTTSDDTLPETSPLPGRRERSVSPRRYQATVRHPHALGVSSGLVGGMRPRKNSISSNRSLVSKTSGSCVSINEADRYSRQSSEGPSIVDVERISHGNSEAARSERTILPNTPKYLALKAAFDMIDTDKSGWISADELMDLLHFRGVAIKYYQALDVIKMYSSNFSDEISFRDFVKVMHDFEGAEVIDLTRAFGHAAAIKAQALERSVSGRSESFLRQTSYGPSDVQNARLAFASIVDGPYVHGIVFILIIVDVFCVIAELLLVATWCHDPSASHRRLRPRARDFSFSDWASGEDASSRNLAGVATDSDLTWCSDCATRQHDWEVVLHTISISILCVFAGQIFLVMLAYRLRFFQNSFFVLDAVVVGGALILELGFHVREGALLVVLFTWRMGRIVHGLVTTVEIGNKRMHSRINQVLRTQLLTKAEGMKDLKSRFIGLTVAEKDLAKLRSLLKPTDMTIENVETVSVDILRRNCKFQIMNNQEVLETLTSLAEELQKLEEHIKIEMEDASAAAGRLDHHHHMKASLTTINSLSRASASRLGEIELAADDSNRSPHRQVTSSTMTRQISDSTSVEYMSGKSPSGIAEDLEEEQNQPSSTGQT